LQELRLEELTEVQLEHLITNIENLDKDDAALSKKNRWKELHKFKNRD